MLVGIYNGTTILKNSLAVPQNVKHGVISDSASQYNTKRIASMLYIAVYISKSYGSQNMEMIQISIKL